MSPNPLGGSLGQTLTENEEVEEKNLLLLNSPTTSSAAIGKQEDNEIKRETVMKFNIEDDEAARAKDEDGNFHFGDSGKDDDDVFGLDSHPELLLNSVPSFESGMKSGRNKNKAVVGGDKSDVL